MRTILTPANFPTLPGQGRPALSDQVRFVGEEIAAVAADTEQAAHEAARAIIVKYEKYPAVIEPEEAMQPFAPPLTSQGNIAAGGPEIYERGNLQQGEAEADVVYERRYATEVQHHNPLEPHGCVASWQGQELVLWDSTQGVHMVKDGLAQALGLPTTTAPHVLDGPGSACYLPRVVGRPWSVRARNTLHNNSLTFSNAKRNILLFC